jgi:hypothetical protein
MREQVSQSKKATTSFSIPTLKQPTRGFGLESLDTAPQATTEVESVNPILTHDIRRISLRPQAKLSISQPGDFYEQQADSVAQQVMRRMAQPGNRQSIQRQEAPEEEEELQMKPLDISTLQRQEAPEEEEELQMKPLDISTLQRQEAPEEEEELQMKPLDISTLQRQEAPEEEEELQMSPMVQRQGQGGMAATSDLETSINQARGGGQPLGDNIRKPMEQAFGADFGGVKVHTDSRSDQLNQSIQARAFTTGQDVFFRQGEYNPGSRGGQELIAHELTHVVQQNSGAVQRKVKTGTPASRTLNFITMKRKHIQMGGNDKYGHWWTEMGGESYGWWPKYPVTGIRQTLFGVEGELNGMTSFGGSATKDPHHGDIAPDVFHPIYKGTKTNSAIEADIRSFASSYSGEWRWTFGFGQNCHTFQESLMKSVGIEQP